MASCTCDGIAKIKFRDQRYPVDLAIQMRCDAPAFDMDPAELAALQRNVRCQAL
jgi:hypothetical protein